MGRVVVALGVGLAACGGGEGLSVDAALVDVLPLPDTRSIADGTAAFDDRLGLPSRTGAIAITDVTAAQIGARGLAVSME